MPTIDEIRQKFPQYGDMSDAALSDAIYKKFYSDLPRAEYDAKIGGAAAKPVAPRPAPEMMDIPGVGPVPTGGEHADIAAAAIRNTPHSAYETGKAMVQPIIHPVETAENIGAIGKGVLQKFGIVSGDDSEKYADAVGKFFADRYGSWDGVKKAISEDPVGVLADLSVVMTGGGSLAARAPGVIGKAGEAARVAGRVIDPLNVPGAVATKVVAPIAANTLGSLTGVGGKSLQMAGEAGAVGGETGKAFRDAISGTRDSAEVVQEAKSALGEIRRQRGEVYREGMKKIGADTTVLDFDKIDAALDKVAGVKNFKGQDLSPSSGKIRSSLSEAVSEWRNLDPKQFHTAEGLDALKQKVGDLRDATQPGTPERFAADQVYNAIKNTIVAQAPEYARVMKGYEEASAQIKEIEKTLSLNPRASIDTALRKLQSVLRDNVNTNYGNRMTMAQYLVDAGAPNLLYKLAGQSLSSWSTRGLGHLANAGEMAFALHELMNANPKAAASIAALIPASSPKLMGLGAYGLGVTTRYARPAARTDYMLGRGGGLQP